jgi:hypothetical protein
MSGTVANGSGAFNASAPFVPNVQSQSGGLSEIAGAVASAL